jgi:hypothetical protein
MTIGAFEDDSDSLHFHEGEIPEVDQVHLRQVVGYSTHIFHLERSLGTICSCE